MTRVSPAPRTQWSARCRCVSTSATRRAKSSERWADKVRTVVVGLGNPILSDDSVGIKVAEQVKRHLSAESGIDVLEAYAGGLRLMEAIAGYDSAIIVDAMK